MYLIRIYIPLILVGVLFFIHPMAAHAQGNIAKSKEFDINSSTLFLDEDKNVIDFKIFIKLVRDKDYKELVPEFDEKGNLKFVTVKLLRDIDLTDISSTPAPTPISTSSSSSQTVPSHSSRKFRFTTVSELEGLQAPYYKAKDVKGREFSSSTLYGKVVVVKFWFMKCAPCLEEIPELNRIANRYKDNPNVKFIAPSTDDFADIRRFNAKRTFNYTILPDAYDFHGDFKVAGYPTHLVIQKDGVVRKVITGQNSKLTDVLSSTIEQALLLEPSDISISEIPQPLYRNDLVIKDENGLRLSKEEFFEKVSKGQYRYYKRIKFNNNEEILLVNKNK